MYGEGRGEENRHTEGEENQKAKVRGYFQPFRREGSLAQWLLLFCA